jgi:hypothetical protein
MMLDDRLDAYITRVGTERILQARGVIHITLVEHLENKLAMIVQV